MDAVVVDKEKITKCFLFSVMSEKKFRTVFTNDLSHYKTGPLIGKSSFASTCVYAGQFIQSDELIAIKKYNVTNLSIDEIISIQKEVINMNQMINPFIILSLASFVVGYEVILILPFMEYGSCSDLIKNHFVSGLSEMIIIIVLKDVLKGLEFLHKKGIIHRSVRASHILVGSDGHAKLTGFRYTYLNQNFGNNSRIPLKIFEFPQNSLSNLKWLSPEILKQDLCGYNVKSDIYSLGITVCELANGFPPYLNTQSTVMLIKKLDGIVPLIYDSSNMDKIEDDLDEELIKEFSISYSTRRFSEHLHSFKNLCCILNPEERPVAVMLSTHSLFKKTSKQKTSFSELVLPIMPLTEKSVLMTNSNVNSSVNETITESKVDADSDVSVNWEF